MNSRKVLLAGYYPPPLGGESVHVRALAQRLLAEGVSVEVLNLRRGAPAGAEYRTITGRVDFLRLLLARLDPNTIFHLHTNGHSRKSWLLIAAAAAALRLRRGIGLLTLHSGLCPAYLDKASAFERWLVRLAVKAFAHVVCVNEEICATVAQLGVDRGRLSLIPAFLGVPQVASLSQADTEVLDRMRPTIVVIGSVEPEYGLPLLMNVFAHVAQEFPFCGCVVIGVTREQLGQIVSIDPRCADRIVCLGQVAHERCLGIMARAAVFVRPTYADGDSVAVREALALGVPVVASDTGGRPEGVALFRPGDGVGLAEQIGQALRARRDPQAHVPDAGCGSMERLLAVYQSLNQLTVPVRAVT